MAATAYCAQLGREVQASELYDIESPDSFDWTCHICREYPMSPAAYDKERNKVSPYFTPAKKDTLLDHECVDISIEIKQRAKEQSLLDAIAPPADVYNKLGPRKVQKNVAQSNAAERIGVKSAGGPRPLSHSTPRRNRQADTIRPIVRQFLDFPNDRHLPLVLGYGVEGQTYRQNFRMVGNFENYDPGVRLFFGALRFDSAHLFREEDALFTLYIDRRPSNKDRKENRFRLAPAQLFIDTSDWSTAKRGRLRNELKEIVRQKKLKENYNAKARPYVFFLGKLFGEKRDQFMCDEHRLIYPVFEEFVPDQRKK